VELYPAEVAALFSPVMQLVSLIVGLLFTVALTISAAPPDEHVFGDPTIWQWAPSRTYHVENYRLALHFDEPKGEVFGDEVITLRPFESHFREFYLDSSELAIDSLTLAPSSSGPPMPPPVKLTYRVEDPRLWITLDHDYAAGTALNVRIVYHGFPRTGLFFVNPTPQYPNWPREVYSQGEAEFNHFWFPCWDYPNDMATSETITTVPEGQTVVSNGKLTRVTHSAGLVTYDWVESIPHSSYLISIAVGPWRKFSDSYRGKPVDYYVPRYVDEATARRSFHLTPDMIDFFSRATGVEYPYEQYAQTTVHNFPFGGQENVSATTLTEWTLHDQRADLDYSSTALVSHELGQHWFGDFVQGRDWADIWLNEGFATYLEALYTQHHEGYDAYRFEIYNDQFAAQTQDRNDYRRPIVDRHFTDPMQMFDSITHEKGAAVLDMLRYLLDGRDAASHPPSQDEPLFQALRHYLEAHRGQAVDTGALIEEIRAATGRELDWFFREWVFMAGNPDYRVEASYDAGRKTERLIVAQTQPDDTITPVFDMPIELAFFGSRGEPRRVEVRDNSRRQEFDIPLDFDPLWVDFDPDGVIDKTLEFQQPLEALVAQAERDPSMMSRLWAVRQLAETAAMPSGKLDSRVAALARVLETDDFYGVRAAAAAGLGRIRAPQAKAALLSALRQPDSHVRTAVVEALGNFPGDSTAYDALVGALHGDSSYAVEAAAAGALARSGMPQAFSVLQAEAAANPEVHVTIATLAGLALTKDPRAAQILLDDARPRVPERIRLSAIKGLSQLSELAASRHSQDLVDVVRAALHDPFLNVRRAGETLVGSFHLAQFRAEIQTEAQDAPTIGERDAARGVLDRLHR
jgi:aminopeptidase N